MKRNRFLSPEAIHDLDRIFEYVLLNDGIAAASHVVGGLEKAIDKVAAMPGIGHRREDFTSLDLRFFTVWSYYIVYKPETEPVEIVRIVHASRDTGAALDQLP